MPRYYANFVVGFIKQLYLHLGLPSTQSRVQERFMVEPSNKILLVFKVQQGLVTQNSPLYSHRAEIRVMIYVFKVLKTFQYSVLMLDTTITVRGAPICQASLFCRFAANRLFVFRNIVSTLNNASSAGVRDGSASTIAIN